MVQARRKSAAVGIPPVYSGPNTGRKTPEAPAFVKTAPVARRSAGHHPRPVLPRHRTWAVLRVTRDTHKEPLSGGRVIVLEEESRCVRSDRVALRLLRPGGELAANGL